MYVVLTICLALIHVHGNTERQLKGKVVVVTGGAKGIGFAIADNFIKNGAKTVIIVDKNRPRGLKAEKQFNSKYGVNKTMFICGDITKDLDRVYAIILQKFNYVDILVNNAGIMQEYEPKKTMETNALGTVLWSNKFHEYMRKDKGGKGGTIINIASVTAYGSDPMNYYYKASKFAILGLTLGMGHEYNYLTRGVRVFAICPGITRTDMSLKQNLNLIEHLELLEKFRAVAPWQTADHVGKAAALLFKIGRTGTAYTVEGGLPPIVSPDRVNSTLT